MTSLAAEEYGARTGLTHAAGTTMIAQGAEARVFRSTFLGRDCVVKERFPKKYRLPVLDEELTRTRMKQEIRSLSRARREGIDAPCVYFCDEKALRIYMEHVPGCTVKQFLYDSTDDAERTSVARRMGRTIARLHAAGIVHGDLTTSNMFIRAEGGGGGGAGAGAGGSGDGAGGSGGGGGGEGGGGESKSGGSSSAQAAITSSSGRNDTLTLIDFGLSGVKPTTEDQGVDIYVLERAMLSTHPDSEALFAEVLNGYQAVASKKAWKNVAVKYEAVRARGRKRLAFG